MSFWLHLLSKYVVPLLFFSYSNFGWDLSLSLFWCSFLWELNFSKLAEGGFFRVTSVTSQSSLFTSTHIMLKNMVSCFLRFPSCLPCSHFSLCFLSCLSFSGISFCSLRFLVGGEDLFQKGILAGQFWECVGQTALWPLMSLTLGPLVQR